MTRYVRIADRPPLRYAPLDVPCPRCSARTGSRCLRVRWYPERVAAVDGRVRRLPAGSYVTAEEVRPHSARRDAAQEETARRLRARRQ